MTIGSISLFYSAERYHPSDHKHPIFDHFVVAPRSAPISSKHQKSEAALEKVLHIEIQ